MNTIEECEAFIDECLARMQELTEGDEERTAEELDEDFTTLEGWVADAQSRIAKFEQVQKLATRTRGVSATPELVAEVSAPNVNTRTEADAWETRGLAGRRSEDIKAQAVTAIESLRSVEPEVQERLTAFVERKDNKYGHGAMHVIGTANPAYREAWRTALLDDPVLVTDAQRAVLAEARAISLSSGFAFPSTVDPTLLYIGDGSRNEIRQIADVRSIVTGTHDVNTIAAVSASMDAESTEVSDDTPADATVQIVAEKAQAFIEFTIESEQDLAGLERDLGTALLRAKDDLEATQMAIGTGTTPQVEGVMIGATTTQTSAGVGAFAVADLYAVQNALPPEYDNSASWLAAKATYNEVRQFGTANNHALWTQLGDGQPALLLGDRTYRNSAVVSTIATGNEILAYGDFESGYRIVDRAGMSVERVQLMLATANNRPNGNRGLYAHWRFGAGVTNANALVALTIQ